MDAKQFSSIIENVDPIIALTILEREANSVDSSYDIELLKLKILLRTNKVEESKILFDKVKAKMPSDVADKIEKGLASKASNLQSKIESFTIGASALIESERINYLKFESAKFQPKIVKEDQTLKEISLSKENIANCLNFIRHLYEQGKYSEAIRLSCILSAIVENKNVQLSLKWALLNCKLALHLSGEKQTLINELYSVFTELETRHEERSFDLTIWRNNLFATSLVCQLYLDSVDIDYDLLIRFFTQEEYFVSLQQGTFNLVSYLFSIYLFCLGKTNSKYTGFSLLLKIANFVRGETSSIHSEFFFELLENYNFAETKKIADEISSILKSDILFRNHQRQIWGNSLLLIIETYSSIYSSLKVKLVQDYLGVSEEDAEIWIVQMIKERDIVAKYAVINGEKVFNFIKDTSEGSSQIEKTPMNLMARTNILVNNITK